MTLAEFKQFADENNYAIMTTEIYSKAITAMERIGYLVDRPCEACTFHGPKGCCKWSCVFEGDGE